MRHRVIGTMGGLVLAAGLLLAPLSGTAFAKKGDPGTDTGKGKACIRAQQKLAQDEQKRDQYEQEGNAKKVAEYDRKIAADQKRKDKACGASSGLPQQGGGDADCEAAKQREIDQYEDDQRAYYAALESGNRRNAQRAYRTWTKNYERNQAATRRACK